MKIRLLAPFLAVCLLFSGCMSWMDGQYVSVKPHMEQVYRDDTGITTVSSYEEILNALVEMVENGVENKTFSVSDMTKEKVYSNMQVAIIHATANNPIGAYAVERITFDQGTTGGKDAVTVNVEYNHGRSEIQRIRKVNGMNAVTNLVATALKEMETDIVLRVSGYGTLDYTQLVQDYAMEHPDEVMEVPQVTVSVYPNSGDVRVIELKFAYQTSRESLRSMQKYVQPVFTSSALYVSGEEEQSVKFARLYAFLMGTTTYTVETSITPTYSLLRHGVGDSKAFATVYAAMCRRAGLDCRIVSGTRAGEPWFWNIICEDEVYYHVDLLQSSNAGAYQKMGDESMSGYVWDYAAYPACGDVETGGETTPPVV